jgi:MFS family permease
MTFASYPTPVYVMVTSAFVLGFVVGPLLWAPASEVLGRRKMFIFSYILFTALSSTSDTVPPALVKGELPAVPAKNRRTIKVQMF